MFKKVKLLLILPQLWIKSIFYNYSFCCILPLTICILCFFVFIFWILRLHLFVVVRPRSWSCFASQRLTHVQRSMRGGGELTPKLSSSSFRAKSRNPVAIISSRHKFYNVNDFIHLRTLLLSITQVLLHFFL